MSFFKLNPLSLFLKYRRERLSFRLLTWVIVSSSFFAFFVSLFQLYSDYKRDMDFLHENISIVKEGYLKILTANAYNINTQQLDMQLHGILELPDIKYAEVVEETSEGSVILAKHGSPIKNRKLSRSIRLEYASAPPSAVQFATLHLQLSLEGVYARLWSRAWIILVTNLAKTLLASTAIFFLFQYIITRHLVRISDFSSRLNVGNLNTPLALTRKYKGPYKDELEKLVDAINGMQENLRLDIRAREEAAVELNQTSSLLTNVINASQDMIFAKDLNLKTILCNKIFAAAVGKVPDELYGKSDEENGWSPKYVNGDDELGVRGFIVDDKKVLAGETLLIESEPVPIRGEVRFFNTIKSPLRDEDGKIYGLIGVARDITEKKKTDDKLAFQARHDLLTGLVNRPEFERRLGRLISSTKSSVHEHALCYMDLDQFKVVNDTCGHIAGDELLRQLGDLLQSVVRQRDTLARLGGDEFGVIMEHCSLEDARTVAKNLQKTIQDYLFSWEGHSFRVGVSMGLVPITPTTCNLTELLKDADAACYMAKDKGRNRIHVDHPNNAEVARSHGEMRWVARLHLALSENRFCLYAQPIMSALDGAVKHYEILLRFIDEEDNIVPPGAFLPAAERYNLISKIDRWVVNRVFDYYMEAEDKHADIETICINISGQSIAETEFQDFVYDTLVKSSTLPKKICFEITETAAITNFSVVSVFIKRMKVLGCQFALDDFGSGLSSFGYLKNLDVDYLKIDGIFVKDVVDDKIDLAMVKSINEIGHVMSIKTIAEFVESDEIIEKLQELGVDYLQGYGVGRPKMWSQILMR